jgi:hypothetical protein
MALLDERLAARIANLREEKVPWDGDGGVCEQVGIPNAVVGRKLLRSIGRGDLIGESYERTPEHASKRRALKGARSTRAR